MLLDFLFIYVFRWGVAGAAIATITSQFVGAIWELNGIWLYVAVAEVLSIFVSMVCLAKNKKKYKYA